MDPMGQTPIADTTESVNQTDLQRTEDGYTIEHVNGITVKRYEPIYQPVEIPPGMKLEFAQWSYGTVKFLWKQSEHRAKLLEFFKTTILKLESQEITSCLAIGLGTFTTTNPYGSPSPESSFYQLVIFETLVKLLSESVPAFFSP